MGTARSTGSGETWRRRHACLGLLERARDSAVGESSLFSGTSQVRFGKVLRSDWPEAAHKTLLWWPSRQVQHPPNHDCAELMKHKRKVVTSPRTPKLSRVQAPDHMSPADWQRALHRQFGRVQAFRLENPGTEPFFSEFRVGNPESKSSYRVAIRGTQAGDNFCDCPDYATNELGT